MSLRNAERATVVASANIPNSVSARCATFRSRRAEFVHTVAAIAHAAATTSRIGFMAVLLPLDGGHALAWHPHCSVDQRSGEGLRPRGPRGLRLRAHTVRHRHRRGTRTVPEPA